MALFFFHLHECGTVVPDEEGRRFAGWDDARSAAIMEAREVMSAEVRQGRLCLSCHIEIAQEGTRETLNVPFRTALAVTGL